MDNSTLQTGGYSAGLIFGGALLYKLYSVINHHRIRGRCCGKTWDASIDIEGTTPSPPSPEIALKPSSPTTTHHISPLELKPEAT
jgi:hypothetical protein